MSKFIKGFLSDRGSEIFRRLQKLLLMKNSNNSENLALFEIKPLAKELMLQSNQNLRFSDHQWSRFRKEGFLLVWNPYFLELLFQLFSFCSFF